MSTTTMGGRIKYHRKRLNLTQEQLAERMGVSAQAVSKWENDLSCPDISILPLLAEVFGITTDELLGKDAAPKAAEVVEDEPRHKDGAMTWSRETERRRGGVLFALYILSVGGLLLAGNLLHWEISWWSILWRTAVLFLGIGGLCGGFSLFSTCLTLGGAYLLLTELGVLHFTFSWNLLLPALLLLWGVSLLLDVLLGKRRKVKQHEIHFSADHDKSERRHFGCVDGFVTCEQNFGESREAVRTTCLRGGTIETNFGNFTVDFSACEAVAADCRLDVESNFGSLTLLIPEKFAVELSRSSSLGAIEVKGDPSATPQGTIHMNTEANFGKITICYG